MTRFNNNHTATPLTADEWLFARFGTESAFRSAYKFLSIVDKHFAFPPFCLSYGESFLLEAANSLASGRLHCVSLSDESPSLNENSLPAVTEISIIIELTTPATSVAGRPDCLFFRFFLTNHRIDGISAPTFSQARKRCFRSEFSIRCLSKRRVSTAIEITGAKRHNRLAK